MNSLSKDVGDALELSTRLGPGASGGAVVDADGRLVGIIRGGVDDDPAFTIAMPAERLARRWPSGPGVTQAICR